MSRLNVEMPEDVLDEFRDRADQVGRSVSDVIRGMIVDWLRQERRAEAELLSLDEQRKKRRAE
jgi:Arc/MetJ-type ribon-helix-helix transcriptional regulator